MGAQLVVNDSVIDDEIVVSVVLPCLNEALSVGACVEEALAALTLAGWLGEVIVVDNGSTDRSVEFALAAGARVISESEKGYGSALRSGIRNARGQVVVMADADCTYPLDQLAQLVGPILRNEGDLVLGSRLSAATSRSMPFLHRFVGTPALTWMIRSATGLDELTDSQSGFRAFRKDRIEKLELRASGMEFASEMLLRSAQHALVVDEIPLGYRERIGDSKLNTWSDGLRHLKLIFGATPHVFLWIPGLLAMLAGLAFSIGSAVFNFHVSWLQPIYLATTAEVLGLISAMSGALFARYSGWVGQSIRVKFAWVSDKTVMHRLQFAGIFLALLGLAINVALFVNELGPSVATVDFRLHWASLAQGLTLDGAILAVGIGVYRLLVGSRIGERLLTARVAEFR